jgi:hypothetical protein
MAQLEPCLNGVRGALNNDSNRGEGRSEVANELQNYIDINDTQPAPTEMP